MMVLGAIALLTSCGSVTVPVLVVADSGERLQGTTTASISGGTFEVAGPLGGEKVTCRGDYNALDSSKTIAIPTTCSDGRTGMITATRDSSGMNGSGQVRLTDGTQGEFYFGNAGIAQIAAADRKPKSQTTFSLSAQNLPSADWLADQIDPYFRCGAETSAVLAVRLQDERPSDIAIAAAARCGSHRAEFLRNASSAYPQSMQAVITRTIDRNFRELAVATALTAREEFAEERARRNRQQSPTAPSIEREV